MAGELNFTFIINREPVQSRIGDVSFFVWEGLIDKQGIQM
jgi:hypothetical protein